MLECEVKQRLKVINWETAYPSTSTSSNHLTNSTMALLQMLGNSVPEDVDFFKSFYKWHNDTSAEAYSRRSASSETRQRL
ncbi:hypothetical protein J6590_064987 [Homalodisca vitripennis]|nr:hypothetical protein J6590_064987 [Homalodisca vitripennis]